MTKLLPIGLLTLAIVASLAAPLGSGLVPWVAAGPAPEVRPLRVGEPQLPPPICEVSATLTGSPVTLCPGWYVGYSLRLRNTGTLPVTNLLVTDPLPAAFRAVSNGAGTQVSGSLDAGTNTMSWYVEILEVGEEVRIELVGHTWSSLPDGQVVRNTFSYNGFNLAQPGTASLSVTVDTALCATATPTPSPEPTEIGYHPTDPTIYSVRLPLIGR